MDKLTFGAKYHKDVINSLALLMKMSTEPDDMKHIFIKKSEEILLNLELTCDQWKDGQFRITKFDTYDGTLKGIVDMILPIGISFL